MRFERLELLIGQDNMEKLKEKSILVLGLGGVGGYTVESLARSGIGTLILVDYDKVDVTNINRQIIATTKTIGKLKTKAWEERIQEINPSCNVISINEKISPENISLLFQYKIDYFVDACDTISVKKELIKICLTKKIPFIASMGTGNKMDPTKLEILDLRKTSYDPIAKILRKMVKEEHIKGKIPVICSTEVPKKVKGKIASTAFVPSVSGLYITSYIINDLLKE